jgi:hypothetical protein
MHHTTYSICCTDITIRHTCISVVPGLDYVNWDRFAHLSEYYTSLRSVTVFLNTPYSLNPPTKGWGMNYDLQTIWIKAVVSLTDVNSKIQTHGVSATPSYPVSQASEGLRPNVHFLVYTKMLLFCVLFLCFLSYRHTSCTIGRSDALRSEEHEITHTHTYTHTHAHTHTCTHTHKHTCTRAQTHTQTHTNSNKHTYTHKHTCTHPHASTHTNTHAHKHTYTRTRTQKQTHALKHKHTCTHTHTNTHVHTSARKHTHTHTQSTTVFGNAISQLGETCKV